MQPYDNVKYGALWVRTPNNQSIDAVPSERWILGSVVNGTGSPRPRRFNTFGYLKYHYRYGRGGSHRSYVDGNGDLQSASFSGVTNLVSPPDGFLGPHPGTYSDELRDRCMAKVFDQIRGNGNLIVDLAESSQTLRMLKATFSLKKLLRDFFRGLIIPKKLRGRSSGQQRLDYITSKWLELRYGWQPLIFSIYDAMDTLLGDHFRKRMYPIKVRSGRRYVTVVKNPYNTATTSSLVTTTEITSVRMQMEVLFDIGYTNPVIDFTSLNPLGIAWELAPLSFVADWLVNIGECLDAWENYVLFADRFVEGYTSYSHSVSRGRSYTRTDRVPILSDPDRPGKALPNPIGYNFEHEESYFTEREHRRSVLSSLPRPAGIRVKVKLNAERLTDAAALVHTLVAKRFR